EKGWEVSYDQTPGEEAHGGYTISLCSSWQQQLMPQYGDVVCLDSTHNTCKGKNSEKLFLSTIVGRD
ncbi:hypothetical protein K439DRAFT_1350737, partial [Ramaria rubella]